MNSKRAIWILCLSLCYWPCIAAVEEPTTVEFVDMNTWSKKGPADQSNWNVQSGGKTVKQTINGLPVFFVSSKQYINITVMGTIQVATTSDDDYVGFVVGYQSPSVSTATNQEYLYQMIKLDWKQSNQGPSFEGYSLAQMSGNVTSSLVNFDYFWVKDEVANPPVSGTFTTLSTNYGVGKGWLDNTEYSFRIIHTTDAVRVRINNVEIFNHAVTFPGGQIGFYNNSQQDVIYGNVRIAPSSDTPAAPVATADIYGTTKATALIKDSVFGIVANDYDPNLDEFRINITSSGNFTGSYTADAEIKNFQTTSGNIALTGNGAFTYTPDALFEGYDEFSYSITDKWTTVPDGTSPVVKVQFYVVNANAAPTDITTSNNIIYIEDSNDALIGILSATDSNVGDQHEFLQDAQSTSALLTISGNQVKLNDATKIGNVNGTHTITITTNDLIGATFQKTLKFVVRSRKPTLGAFDNTPSYTENAAALTLDSNLTVLDYDNTNISGANLIISANLLSSDLLSVNTAGTSITAAAFNTSTGILQLSGTDTPANYQTVLRTATYLNSGDNPTSYGSKTARTIELRATDGGNISSSSNINLNITAINDAPDSPGVNASPTYTEGGVAISLDSSITINDADHLKITGANVVISNNLTTGDTLAATNAGNITSTWSAATGVLSLSGNDSLTNYDTVIQSVTYVSSSDNPTNFSAATQRTLQYQLNDGTLLGSTNSITLSVTAVNDAGTLTHSASTNHPTYTENAAAVVLDSSLSLSDVDNTQAVNGNVTISANFLSGDTLAATTAGTSVSSSYSSSTGVLSLSGTDTLANYQTVLRSVTYLTSSENPDDYGTKTKRLLSFTFNDGGADSTLANGSWKVNITTSNDAPAITGTNATPTYTEGAAAVVLDSTLSVSDVDDLRVSGANVLISGNFLTGDTLAASSTANITVSWDNINALLSMTGADFLREYESLLETVTYVTSSDNPDNYATQTGRTLEFRVSDATALSAAAILDMRVSAVNDAPVASNTSPQVTFTENGAAVLIDNALTLSDVDDLNMESASVTVSGNHNTGDTLSVNTAGTTLSTSYNSTTGVLSITGSDTLANYQTVLRTLNYISTSDYPDQFGSAKVISTVFNDGNANSTAIMAQINLSTNNDAPTLSAFGGSVSYAEHSALVTLDADVTLGDVDNPQIAGANITISANLLSGDVLSVDTSGTNITSHGYDSQTGLLRLSGSDTLANYQAVVRKIQYRFSGDNPDDFGTKTKRDVTLSIFDGAGSSATGSLEIQLTVSNDAPVLSNMNGDTIGYAENGAAKLIDSDLNLSDSDNQNFTGATLVVSDGRSSDVLSIDTTGTSITAIYNSTTSTLTLSGTDSIANYQKALRSARYNSTSNNPTDYSRHLTRSVSLVLSDGTSNSNTGTTIVRLTEQDDSPVVTPSSLNTTYTENASATAIDASMAVSDVDSLRLQLATVTISDNIQTSDRLSASTGSTSLTQIWDPIAGKLTLSGNDTLANYQSVLRTVSFFNSSENPDLYGSLRGRGIQVLAHDGSTFSDPANYEITITTNNDAPVIGTPLNTTIGYTEGSSASTLYSVLSISDPDDRSLTSASVVIASVENTDLLSADTTGTTLSASYNTATGNLSITGAGSLEHYQLVLRSVAYRSTSNNPAIKTKSVSTIISDGQLNSNNVTITVNITAQNNSPTISAFGGTQTFTENGSAVSLDTDLKVSDVDSALLQGATVAISDGFVTGDSLSVSTTGTSITASFNSSTGVLTLTGPATAADFQTVIRTLSYVSTSDNPGDSGNKTTKTIALWVNDGSSDSVTATSFVSVTENADGPILTFSVASTSFTENSSAVLVDSALTLTDPDSPYLISGNVAISGNRHASDVLSLDTSGTVITATTNAQTGVIELIGNDTAANYQRVLRTLRFINASERPATDSSDANRILSINLRDNEAVVRTTNFEIMVVEINDLPTISTTYSRDQTLSVNDVFLFEASSTDIDDTNLIYILNGLPSWASFDSSIGRINGSPGLEFAGEHYPMKLSISDRRGGLDSLDIRLQIRRVNVGTIASGLTSAITVKVVDELGRSIVGALVTITGTETMAFSDATGETRLSVTSDARSQIELRVSADSYVTTVERVSNPSNKTVTITLKKGVIIKGSVTSGGVAITSAKVVAWTEALGYFDVLTDTQGQFELAVPRQSSTATWALGASKEGYNFTSTSVEVKASDDIVEVNLNALALTSTTLLSWETHRATDFAISRQFQVVIKAQPAFSSGDEFLGTLGLDAQKDQITGLAYDESRQAIVFTFTVKPNETQINIPIALTPKGADQALSSVIFDVNDNASAEQNNTTAKVQQQVNPIVGGKADLSSRSVVDENGNTIIDYSGFEVPPFGIRDEVNYIRMERTQRSTDFFTDSRFVGSVYSVDAFRIVIQDSVETVEKLDGNTFIRSIYLSFRFDSNTWKPYEDRIFYSQDGGRIWILFSNDNIINVDYEKEIVTIESTHLSLWVLGQPGDGLIGNAGGGSSGGGGCILKKHK